MKPIHLSMFTLLVSAALAISPRAAHAAESYDGCAGFISSVPTTVSTQGVWCLKADLSTAITSGSAITIATNNVTIDCNGFKLGGLAAGVDSLAYGIHATARQNITVRNCNVRGFFRGIVVEGAGSGHLLEDNRLDNNLVGGIFVAGDNNRVQRNRVFDTGGRPNSSSSTGIDAAADIIDNTVSGVFATDADTSPTGIRLRGNFTQARDNTVSALIATGTGKPTGIQVQGGWHRIRDNDIYNANVLNGFGIGIDASGASNTYCGNNLASGAVTPILNCFDAGSNYGD